MKRIILTLLLFFSVSFVFAQPKDTTVTATLEFVVNTDRIIHNDYYNIFARDVNLNWLVVKLSYVYNGVTAYDVRVPIKLPEGGLKPGKYYKYELNITSTGNGTNDPNEASDEKDEIIIESLNPIVVNLTVAGYEVGADEKIII